jgi:high-affinity iron transporter
MVPALLIMVREGFEAALVVSIVFAYLRRIGRLDLGRSAWAGVAVAAVVSVLVGVVVHVTIGSLDGVNRLRSFAAVSLAAAAVLTWMIFWMQRQSRAIKGDLEHHIDEAISSEARGRGAARGVAVLTFLAVVREGVEAALFLVAAATSADGGQVALGAVVGLAIAAALGVGVYAGGRRLPMKTFFTVSGLVIIVFAAGLVARTVLFLQGAGDLGTIADNIYDLRSQTWLTQQSEFGRFLAAMFGWDPRPSLEQVVGWVGYLVPVTWLFLRGRRPAAPAPSTSTSAATRPTAAVS